MKFFSKDFRLNIIPSDKLFLFTFISASILLLCAFGFGIFSLLPQFSIKNSIHIYMCWIALALFVLSIIVFILSRFIYLYKLQNVPVHKERGRVMHKKQEVMHFENSSDLILYGFTIEFSDNSSAVMDMGKDSVRPLRDPDLIVVNDTGFFYIKNGKVKKQFLDLKEMMVLIFIKKPIINMLFYRRKTSEIIDYTFLAFVRGIRIK